MGLAVDRAVARDPPGFRDPPGVVEVPSRTAGDRSVEIRHAALLLPEEGVIVVGEPPPLGGRTPDDLVGAVDGEGDGLDRSLAALQRAEVARSTALPEHRIRD